MNNNYLRYNNTSINDNSKNSSFFGLNEQDCIQKCSNDSNCLGLNITNPICNNSYDYTECIKKNYTDTGISNNKPINLNQYNCVILNDINDANTVLSSTNNTSYIKNKNANNIPSLASSNTNYYLIIGDMYLSINNELNHMFLVGQDQIENASTFYFNSNGNIIESKTNKCLQTNGDYLILTNCTQNNTSQEFIFENKLNTIRPLANTNNNSLCFTLDSSQRIILQECNYNNKNNQSVKFNNNTIENFNSEQTTSTQENTICSNQVYKLIINIILIIILLFFIYYIYRETYKDNNYVSQDTPFN